jgi:hypothetical protein
MLFKEIFNTPDNQYLQYKAKVYWDKNGTKINTVSEKWKKLSKCSQIKNSWRFWEKSQIGEFHFIKIKEKQTKTIMLKRFKRGFNSNEVEIGFAFFKL